jgi:hypothetical protein
MDLSPTRSPERCPSLQSDSAAFARADPCGRAQTWTANCLTTGNFRPVADQPHERAATRCRNEWAESNTFGNYTAPLTEPRVMEFALIYNCGFAPARKALMRPGARRKPANRNMNFPPDAAANPDVESVVWSPTAIAVCDRRPGLERGAKQRKDSACRTTFQ